VSGPSVWTLIHVLGENINILYKTTEFSEFYLNSRIKVGVRNLEGENILEGENSNRISLKALATKRDGDL